MVTELVTTNLLGLQWATVPMPAAALTAVLPLLTQAALDFVVEEDLRAHLTCWYIQKYVKENPLPQYLERLQP